jgi:hypothetical protein
MKIQITGTRNGVYWPAPGGEMTLPDLEAAKLCASGLAVPVVIAEPEKAVVPEPEKRGGPKRARSDTR